MDEENFSVRANEKKDDSQNLIKTTSGSKSTVIRNIDASSPGLDDDTLDHGNSPNNDKVGELWKETQTILQSLDDRVVNSPKGTRKANSPARSIFPNSSHGSPAAVRVKKFDKGPWESVDENLVSSVDCMLNELGSSFNSNRNSRMEEGSPRAMEFLPDLCSTPTVHSREFFHEVKSPELRTPKGIQVKPRADSLKSPDTSELRRSNSPRNSASVREGESGSPLRDILRDRSSIKSPHPFEKKSPWSTLRFLKRKIFSKKSMAFLCQIRRVLLQRKWLKRAPTSTRLNTNFVTTAISDKKDAVTVRVNSKASEGVESQQSQFSKSEKDLHPTSEPSDLNFRDASSLPNLLNVKQAEDPRIESQMKAESLSSKDRKERKTWMPKFGLGRRNKDHENRKTISGSMDTSQSFSDDEIMRKSQNVRQQPTDQKTQPIEPSADKKGRTRAATAPTSHSRPIFSIFVTKSFGSSTVFTSPESSESELQKEHNKAVQNSTSKVHAPSPLQASMGEDNDERCIIRVFKHDHSSTIINCRLHATAAEVVKLVARKFFIPEAAKCSLVFQTTFFERVLKPDECPAMLQTRTLKSFGYRSIDKFNTVVMEDVTALLRFTLRDSNYWQEKASRMQKMTIKPHFSLSGLNPLTLALPQSAEASNIEILDLSRCPNIADIPAKFAEDLITLRSLMMSNNYLEKLPRSIGVLSTLVELDLSSNRLSKLEDAGIEQLPCLEVLNLSRNRLLRFPASIAKACQRLKSLDLSNNRLTSFPEEILIHGAIPSTIGNLKTLLILRVAFNTMQGSLPLEFGKLEELLELDLRANKFGENLDGDEVPIFSVLSRCRSLEVLQADCNMTRWYGRWEDRKEARGGFSDPLLSEVEVTGTTYLKNVDGLGKALTTTVKNELSDDTDGEGEVGPGRCLELSKLRKLTMSFQASSHPEKRPAVLRISNMTSSLTHLNCSGVGLIELPFRIFDKLRGLEVLNLAGNKLKRLPPFTFPKVSTRTASPNGSGGPSSVTRTSGRVGVNLLKELYLSNNALESLPRELGDLQQLVVLEIQQNQIVELPPDIWKCGNLRFLNASSNLLEGFPLPDEVKEPQSVASKLRVPRQPTRTDNIATTTSPTQTTPSPILSPLSKTGFLLSPNPLNTSNLANNLLIDEIYIPLHRLPNLIHLNLSLNNIVDITPMLSSMPHTVGVNLWHSHLTSLFLSGNAIASLPGEIEKARSIRWLFLNGNRLSTVPGELAKLNRLRVLDVSCQLGGRGDGSGLRYNITNWPYDWNWNWNIELRYLNLSGNTRLEIKPSPKSSSWQTDHSLPHKDLADFSALTRLKLLGLMDVTCLVVPPDETSERRIRTTGSDMPMMGIPSGFIGYGVADILGMATDVPRDFDSPLIPTLRATSEASIPSPLSGTTVVSTASTVEQDVMIGVWDLVQPKFRGRDNEALFGVFDGRGSRAGNRFAKHLYDHFGTHFARELSGIESDLAVSTSQGHIMEAQATPVIDPAHIKDAMRRAFLHANRELGLLYHNTAEVASEVEVPLNGRGNSFSSTSSRRNGAFGSFDSSSGDHPASLAGCSATLIFMLGPLSDEGASRCSIYVANIGDGLAAISGTGGKTTVLSKYHSLLPEAFIAKATAPLSNPKVQGGTYDGITINIINESAANSIKSQSGSTEVLQSHRPSTIEEPLSWPESEIERIHSAGGWISSSGLVHGTVDITRGFGYFPLLGSIIADPNITHMELDFGDDRSLKPDDSLKTGDEFIVLSSYGIWRALSMGGSYEDGANAIVAIARSAAISSRPHTTKVPLSSSNSTGTGAWNASSRAGNVKGVASTGWGSAASMVRDKAVGLAGSCGSGHAVMVLGLRDLASRVQGDRRKSVKSTRRGSKVHDEAHSMYKEIQPPTGRLALVFTDIKNSTSLWENFPTAMRSAIKLHNATMRRLLLSSGGYEVKTEGDAFMLELRNIDWPKEILGCADGAEVAWWRNSNNEHVEEYTGSPNESRMDYYGPVVNRSARVSSVSQGGQILVSYDAMKEIQTRIGYRTSLTLKVSLQRSPPMSLCWRIIDGENVMESTSKTAGDEKFMNIKGMGLHAWYVGEVKLKGLEAPEVLYMVDISNGTQITAKVLGVASGREPPRSPTPTQTLSLRGPADATTPLDKSQIESLTNICLRLELLAAKSGDEWQGRKLTVDSTTTPPSSHSHHGLTINTSSTMVRNASGLLSPARGAGPSQTTGKVGVMDHPVERADNESSLAILSDLSTRIEIAVSVLYMTRSSPFSKVLRSLGEAMDDDPNQVIQALQMYTQQLSERKKIPTPK
ncbi:hypothetical protein BC829DRAFT_439676 [Chytridium lagenaria]|nr:hypothetical protein BC829DRAFT_439676 [Chytridium lagenaria]